MKRIVLTGGPGAGKTYLSAHIVAARPERFVPVPEAATQVYDHLRTRWDRLDLPGRRDVQRRIYALQIEQETAAAVRHPDKDLLLDRGTIDGAAYWPEGPEDYWRELGTDFATELARYDAVVWLQTSAAIPGAYDRDTSNPRRFEAVDAAIASGDAVRRLWSAHPRLFHVDAYPDVGDKLAAVLRLLDVL